VTVHPHYEPFFRAAGDAQKADAEKGADVAQKAGVTAIGEDPEDEYDIDLGDEDNRDWQHRTRRTDQELAKVAEDTPAASRGPTEWGKRLKTLRGGKPQG
jgi:hypothetical protein